MDTSELRAKPLHELEGELVELRREQFNLRMQSATGQLPQHHEHRRVRRQIARVKTVIAEVAREESKS